MNIFLVVIISSLIILSIILFFLLRISKSKDSALFQQQILELSRQISEMKENQKEVPKVLLEGQIKNIEVLQNQLTQMVGTFNQQISSLTNTLNEQLSKSHFNIGQQLEGSAKIASDLKMKLGELSEAAKEIKETGKDISKLQDILQSPKLRGNVGEFFLEDLLKQILPSQNYEMQYQFKTGEKVDAMIKIGNYFVPVDSKFPLESFNRIREAKEENEKRKTRKEFIDSVKKKVEEISTKYIRPEEGTSDFALMYIPAENVFYETIIKDDEFLSGKSLASYAVERKVIPTSPNSFYAYLMVIVFGLRGMHIEKKAEEIRGKIIELQQYFSKFYENFTKLGKNIYYASHNYEEAKRIAERFNDKMSLITGETVELKELPETSEELIK